MFFSSRKGSEDLPDAVEVVEHHLINWSGTHEVRQPTLLALQRQGQWQSLALMLVARARRQCRGQALMPPPDCQRLRLLQHSIWCCSYNNVQWEGRQALVQQAVVRDCLTSASVEPRSSSCCCSPGHCGMGDIASGTDDGLCT